MRSALRKAHRRFRTDDSNCVLYSDARSVEPLDEAAAPARVGWLPDELALGLGVGAAAEAECC